MAWTKEEKDLEIQKPRTSTGKTYSLHPSEKLYLSFTNFLEKTKEHIAHNLGYENEKDNNFYFGTSLLSANIIPKPTQINLKTKELYGCEVLARWKKKGAGLISPMEFIPYVEKSGQIIPITNLLIEKTIKDLITINWQLTDRVISINLVPQQLENWIFRASES